MDPEHRELLSLIVQLSKALKNWQHHEIFSREVTFAQFYILDAVAQNKTLKLSALHKILGVEKSTTSRLLKPLIQHDLILCEKSARDGRSVNLKLTGRGQHIYQVIQQQQVKLLKELAKHLSNQGYPEIVTALQTFSMILWKVASEKD